MKIVSWLNLALAVGALVAVVVLRWNQQLLTPDHLIQWAPIGPETESVVLPLAPRMAADDYVLRIESLPSQELVREVETRMAISGMDAGGVMREILVGGASVDPNTNEWVIGIYVPSVDVDYLSIQLDHEIRGQIRRIGLTESTMELKATSLEASLAEDATRALVVLLAVVIIGQAAVVYNIMRRSN